MCTTTLETRRIKAGRDSDGDNNAKNDDRNEAKEMKMEDHERNGAKTRKEGRRKTKRIESDE